MSSKLSEVIKTLPSAAKVIAKRWLKAHKNPRPTGKAFDNKQNRSMLKLLRAGLSYRTIETICGLKDRNGNNAYDCIQSVIRTRKAKVVKAKAKPKTRKARKVKDVQSQAQAIIQAAVSIPTPQAPQEIAATATPTTVVEVTPVAPPVESPVEEATV